MMNHFFDSKRWKFILSSMTLIALILLALGLRDVNFKPSQPLNNENQANDFSRPLVIPSFLSTTLAQQAIVLITIMAVLIATLFVIPPEIRKPIFIFLFIITLSLVLYYFIFRSPTASPEANATQQPNQEYPPTAANVTPQAFQPPPEFTPPQVSHLMLYLISFAMVVGVIFAGWMLYRWRPKPALVSIDSLEGIGQAARLALDDLAAGHEEGDAIVRCYARMSGVVQQRRSLRRGLSMTAAEFAKQLEEGGLPRESVRRLTRLFEAARYGASGSRPVEVDEAKACLAEIARFCGEIL